MDYSFIMDETLARPDASTVCNEILFGHDNFDSAIVLQNNHNLLHKGWG